MPCQPAPRVLLPEIAAVTNTVESAAAMATTPTVTEEVPTTKTAKKDQEWMWEAKNINVPDIPFTQTPGPINCPKRLTPFEAFHLLFPLELLTHIIIDTINYAAHWEEYKKLGTVTAKEMYTYFAILLVMSIKTAPSLKDHWSEDPLLGSPWIYEKMGRDRWLAIHKALHFDIHFVETTVRDAACQYWIPSQKVCIDEGIGPWKGRKKGVKTYILGKPHPNGIKIYILADENGYVYDFWIYHGNQPPTADIVVDFVKKLPG